MEILIGLALGFWIGSVIFYHIPPPESGDDSTDRKENK